MFSKIKMTNYPPQKNPVLVWDGKCGFCKFWVIRLNQHTRGRISFRTYQEAADQFRDIPVKEFKKASRLIELDGRVYSGPDSLYRSLQHSNKKTLPWHYWYHKFGWFAKLSDHGYNFIAKHRPMMFTLTKLLFGEQPQKIKHYWLLYAIILPVLLLFILD
ncbi:MAG: DUF393 domain-containing protein [Pricia sp.]|nr:DUF393 domain-containing protein [Pricia sp.]